MTSIEYTNLQVRDVIRGKLSGESYTIVYKVGTIPVIQRTLSATNPDEWDLILTADYKRNQ